MRRPLLATFFVLVFLASSVAALVAWGTALAGASLAIPSGIWLWRAGRKRAAKWLLAVVLVPPILAALLLPAQSVGNPRAACRYQLRQIALALLNYQQRNGCFPPSFVCDEDGRPMHSWRVLILPYMKRDDLNGYMECEDLYKKYSFKEPWNGPNNRLLESRLAPYIYTCPFAPRAGPNCPPTSYVLVTGPSTAFPEGKPRGSGEITRRPCDTVLVVEVANSDIHWMEPRDPSVDDLVAGRADVCRPLTSTHVERSYWLDPEPASGNIVCADGRVHFLRGPIGPDDARVLLTVNDGQDFDVEKFAKRMPLVGRPRWDHIIGLPAFCLSFVALLSLALTTRRRHQPPVAEPLAVE